MLLPTMRGVLYYLIGLFRNYQVRQPERFLIAAKIFFD